MKRIPLPKILVLMASLMCSIGAVAQEAYACYTDSNSTLTFYYDISRNSREGTTYDLNTYNNYPDWYKDGTSSYVRRVIFTPSFANVRPTTTACWFMEMPELVSIKGMQLYLNTSNVTNMESMFALCNEGLTSLDLSGFNTRKVVDMGGMFFGCSGLTSLDLSGFDTGNVTNMSGMFMSCFGLTSLDLSGFDTRNVTDMEYMFDSCFELTSLDLSGFDTRNVTRMEYMFHFCTGLTSLDLSGFDTGNVTNMGSMFSGCSGLTSLDLSHFDTENLTSMESMFAGCSDLNTIYVGSGWSIAVDAEAHYSDGMFYGCTSLVGGMGTAYDAEHMDATYAHIDGGPSDPGYFTAGPASLRGDADGNGEVGISDVTAIIDYLLKGDATTINLTAADADGNGEIGISDVTAIIDYLLKRTWPDDVPEEPQTETFTVNGVSFTMGATAEQGSDAFDSEKPAHEVTLSSYRIGQTEVTQELWQAVMGNNPSCFTSNNGYTDNLQRPVEKVTWNDCQTFITQLNALTGKTFRLPTEAEWEFAARVGNQSQAYKYSGSNTIDDVAWYWGNSCALGSSSPDYGTHAIATKAPNELGLYDMSGNVWEWCQDMYNSYSSDAQINPTGPSTGSTRVRRGGSWGSDARDSRVSIRYSGWPAVTCNNFLGLRLAL